MTLLDYCKDWKCDLGHKTKLTYAKSFKNWQNILTERVINMFRWSGLPFPEREIEIILIMVGFCGVTRFTKSGTLGSVYGSMSGVTNYLDIFTTFTYATPLESGMRKIDKDLVVVNNNAIRLPSIFVINNYAHLLAHADLSLQALLINCRSGGIIKASSQKQVDAVNSWYNSLYNGKSVSVLDDDSLESFIDTKNMDFLQTTTNQRININDYYIIRENLLKSFYSDIGISGTTEKRANLLQDEIYTNVNRVIFNTNDMLREREVACEKINQILNANVSVEFNYEIVQQMEAMSNKDNTEVNINGKEIESNETGSTDNS